MEVGKTEEKEIFYNPENLNFSKISDISEIISNGVFSKEGKYLPELKDIIFHYFVFKHATNLELPEDDDFEYIFKIMHSDFGKTFKEKVSNDVIYQNLLKAVDEKIDYKKQLNIRKRNDILSDFITKLGDFIDNVHALIKKYDEKYGSILSKSALKKLFKKISDLDEKSLVQAILQIQESGDELINLAEKEVI